MVKAIKSIIPPEQYNQSNTINDTARAMRSKQLKQYGQQYVQDKLGDSDIAKSTYAKTRDLSKKPDVQEVDVKR